VGEARFEQERPESCGEPDLSGLLPGVTRGWHMMPGGVLMREPSHRGP
jgi:hypothetical protein